VGRRGHPDACECRPGRTEPRKTDLAAALLQSPFCARQHGHALFQEPIEVGGEGITHAPMSALLCPPAAAPSCPLPRRVSIGLMASLPIVIARSGCS
jgi:hypothetical protein